MREANFILPFLMQALAPSRHEQDLAFVQRVLATDAAAAAELRTRYHGKLVGVLRARGASQTEAEDLVADLWADCFAPRGNREPLLSKYQGRCALESWLLTVATNRLVDLKRRQSFRVDVSPSPDSPEDFFDRRPQPEKETSEQRLVELLRDAIKRAFAKQEPDAVLMLKLVHLHDLTQREIARMWGWHESKVSRTLDGTRQSVSRIILAELKRIDPWLELRWEDFVELCAGSSDVF
ncbi:MAG TPA: RNA polymerase sigma factor [Chthoniobacterales bacterium]|jgi:RNA polymerase sigma factor (sigma-70 family)|nr:RNA polymerase sigma factor [Chthoniobacterales bacterium]